MYRHRDGRLEQISQDHALVEELVERGVLTPDQAIDHPHGNLVTRAVGAADRLFLDVEIVPIQAGDLFILCSDGLEQEVAEEEMSVIARASDTSQLSHTLLARALAIGARDNVTVITVAIHGQPGSPKRDHEAGGCAQSDVEEDADTERHEQQPPI
jgi:serine/threonine protein phosphatase PrpC